MGKLFVMMGKSASGKDTLYRKLLERCPGLYPVIPYTTRPVRAGEKPGAEYYFVTEERMEQMGRRGQIVESRCYQTVKGAWYYFTAEDGQIDFGKGDFILISTLEGYGKIRRFYGEEKVVPLYIEADGFERLERSLNRERKQENPCVAEVCRRFLADEKDFSDEKLCELGIPTRIQNDSLDEAIEQIRREMRRI